METEMVTQDHLKHVFVFFNLLFLSFSQFSSKQYSNDIIPHQEQFQLKL